MSGNEPSVRLELAIDPSGLDDEATDGAARSLRRAIDEADLDGVRAEPVRGEAPSGAKGDAFTVGALALAVAPVLVEQVLQLVREWCTRPGAQPVKVHVKVGDREISGEFDASTMTPAKISAIAKKLRAVTAE